jgi:hypothetical protein
MNADTENKILYYIYRHGLKSVTRKGDEFGVSFEGGEK